MYRLQLSLTDVPNQQPLALTWPSVMMQYPLITQGYNSMPFSACHPSMYQMQGHYHWQSHAPQGYNAPYNSGPVYSMPVDQHPNRHYHWQNQIQQGYNAPYITGPVYSMGGQRPNRHQGQARSSGPWRNQRKRYCKAEPQNQDHNIHESSGLVVNDRSTGVNPGHAWIGASNETRAGKVCRTPSENLLMTDFNLT